MNFKDFGKYKRMFTLLRLLMKDRKNLWLLLGPIVIDLGKELSDEALAAAAQVAEELMSSDGLTHEEMRSIAETRLEALIAEEIGDPMTDEVFDFLLTLILRRVQKEVPPVVVVEVPKEVIENLGTQVKAAKGKKAAA